MSSRRGMLGHVFTVGAFTSLSRVLGLVREMLQARLIGAGVEQSAFTLAFAIPNMARKLFGEGALTAAFVPVFSREVEATSVAKAARLARAVMTMTFLMLGAALLVAFGALGVFSRFHAAFGVADSERLRLVLGLVGTLLPYMLFICGAAFGMGVLNALGRFRASSFMPALLNLVWIGALAALAFFPRLAPAVRIRYVALAILAAGALQMLFMFSRMAAAGVRPGLDFSSWRDEKVRLVWRNVALGAMGAGAVQVNYALDQFLAQLASPWAAGVIGYAERLMDLPLGIVGVAFGTVLLPTFAAHFARGEAAEARETLRSSVVNLMLVMLPAAAGLAVLAPDVTRVIYEGREFDVLSTLRVSRALAVYALGLGFFGLQKTLVPWFLAQGDMTTPLRVSVASVVLNATLNVLAVWLLPVEWRHVGLAVSTVLCAGAGAALLAALARRKNGCLGLLGAVSPVVRTLFAALAMALALVLARPVLRSLVAGAPGADFWLLALEVGLGMAVYGGLAFAILRTELLALRESRRGRRA